MRKNHKLFAIILFLCVLFVSMNLITACEPKTEQEILPSVTSITITGRPENDRIEKTNENIFLQLGITSLPERSRPFSVNWSSDAQGVASIDQTGKITILATGSATITASVIGAADIQNSFSLTVFDNTQYSISITGEPTEPITVDSDFIQLGYNFTPENVEHSVTWSSSDSHVATIDSTGMITIIGAGITTISLTANEYSSATDSFDLTVVPNQISEINITNLPSNNELPMGMDYSLNYDYAPANSASFDVIWSSSNTDVATVSGIGKISSLNRYQCY